MADIIFRYDKMEAAAAQIDDLAAQYKTAADTFNTNFNAAIVGWEGNSKDKMVKFVNGTVYEYTATTVPQVLAALANLLRANSTQMSNADDQIAENIPG